MESRQVNYFAAVSSVNRCSHGINIKLSWSFKFLSMLAAWLYEPQVQFQIECVCLTAFSMDVSHGLLLFFCLLPSPRSIPPPPQYLIAVPLMPPAQSQPRPAVSPQRFPVSSSCSSPSLSPHFLSLSTWSACLFFHEGNIITAIRPPGLSK